MSRLRLRLLLNDDLLSVRGHHDLEQELFYESLMIPFEFYEKPYFDCKQKLSCTCCCCCCCCCGCCCCTVVAAAAGAAAVDVGGTGFSVERLDMAAEAACFSASDDDEDEEEAAVGGAAAASLASISEGSSGSCFGSRSGGCEVVVEDEMGAVCGWTNRIRTGNCNC